MTATECYIKLVDATTLTLAYRTTIANLFQDNIICRFDIPKRLNFYNGNPFVNMHVRRLRNNYGINHG